MSQLPSRIMKERITSASTSQVSVGSDGSYFAAEGLHRLCHQRQAPDAVHAAEQTHLPVPRVALRGVPVLRVHHHGHDSAQHRGAHDEGELLVRVRLSSLEQ